MYSWVILPCTPYISRSHDITCNDLLIKPKLQLQIWSTIIQYDIYMMRQKWERIDQVKTYRVVLLLQTKYVLCLQRPFWPHAAQIEPIQFVLVRKAGPLQPQFDQGSAEQQTLSLVTPQPYRKYMTAPAACKLKTPWWKGHHPILSSLCTEKDI